MGFIKYSNASLIFRRKNRSSPNFHRNPLTPKSKMSLKHHNLVFLCTLHFQLIQFAKYFSKKSTTPLISFGKIYRKKMMSPHFSMEERIENERLLSRWEHSQDLTGHYISMKSYRSLGKIVDLMPLFFALLLLLIYTVGTVFHLLLSSYWASNTDIWM